MSHQEQSSPQLSQPSQSSGSLLPRLPGPLILFSGGLDSLACIAYYRKLLLTPEALFVDYGQAPRKREASTAAALAKELGLPFHTISLSGMRPRLGYIPGRNGLLLMLALMHASGRSGIVSIGIHRGSNYSDCTAQFIREVQDVYDLYSNGTLQIEAPFVEWTKGDVWTFLLAEGYPVSHTYSCETADAPCGTCASCRDVRMLNAR
ncbi:MAG: 7-cyano-7-deazaguanine synthase [Vicinamibacterales bacterium]